MINEIIQGDSLTVLKTLPDNYVDMILTSPPYDDLRDYHGNHSFDFEQIAIELLRVLKDGSAMVWIVGDKTINGDERGIPFDHALYFKKIGFKLHDTMIYQKIGTSFPNPETHKRYLHCFDFMFIFSKNRLTKTKWHPIKDRKNKEAGKLKVTHTRSKDDNDNVKYKNKIYVEQNFGLRYNIWKYNTGYNISTTDKIAFNHPAIFPEKLTQDHIRSWSNDNDVVLDPFIGSGTTAKMALLNNRRFIGIEINHEYIEIARKRIDPYLKQEKLLLSEIPSK